MSNGLLNPIRPAGGAMLLSWDDSIAGFTDFYTETFPAYQNYNVAVNLSQKTIYTYMGVLKPGMGNANFCSAG